MKKLKDIRNIEIDRKKKNNQSYYILIENENDIKEAMINAILEEFILIKLHKKLLTAWRH